MADSFLEVYATTDFSVLVQAEVASITQKSESAKKLAAGFAAKAAAAPQEESSPAPWHRRGPPPEASAVPLHHRGPPPEPAKANAEQPLHAGSLPKQPAAQAIAVQALQSLQNSHRPIATMRPASFGPSAPVLPAASHPPAPVLHAGAASRQPAPVLPDTSKPPAPALHAGAASMQPAPALPATSRTTPAALPKSVAKGPPPKKRSPEGEDEVTYLKRRLHNTQRSGRNRLYYQVLNLHGAAAAAKYWVEPAEKAKSSSSASSNAKGQ